MTDWHNLRMDAYAETKGEGIQMEQRRKNRSKQKKAEFGWKSCGRGILLAMGIALIGSMIIATCIHSRMMQMDAIPAATTAAAALGSFVGAWYLTHHVKGKKLWFALSVGLGEILVLLIGNLLLTKLPPVGIGRIAIACLASSVAAGLVGQGISQKGYHRKRF